MSSRALPVNSFLGPLKGKTSTFVVRGRPANLAFAKVVTSLVALGRKTCTILDLDALYSSNADSIFGNLPIEAARTMQIHMPEPEADVERVLPRFFGVESQVLIIDSLNSLYHLLARNDGSARSRKLSFVEASLSYFARVDGKAVILTMYRRERPARTTASRSISGQSDITASVQVEGTELSFRCERGSAWPGGRFSIRIP